MIKDTEKWKKFNEKYIAEEKFTYHEALAIYEDLHNYAVSLGVINSENMLEGIETDVMVARVLNGLK